MLSLILLVLRQDWPVGTRLHVLREASPDLAWVSCRTCAQCRVTAFILVPGADASDPKSICAKASLVSARYLTLSDWHFI